jgi:hypothetical protein
MDEPRPKPKQLKLVRVEWISFYMATIEIEKRLSISHAEARRRLRGACAEARIRSLKEHREEFELPAYKRTVIAPREWREREVDYDGPDPEGFLTSVEVNEGDFQYWLKGLPLPEVPNQRDTEIRKLLEAGKYPPDKMSWKEFCGKVRDGADGWTKTGGELKEAPGFSQKQIQRAVKRMRGTDIAS